MKTRSALAALLVCAAALAADLAPPVLRMPGSADRPIESAALTGKDRVDVRTEDLQGATIFHGMPLLDVLEKNGLDAKTMASQRRVASGVVLVSARDGYTVVFSIGELLMHRGDPRVFLVAETGQGPLPPNEGPVRLVVQGDRVRSPYGLARIEVRYLADNAAERKKSPA
jgi:hypothetical protein